MRTRSGSRKVQTGRACDVVPLLSISKVLSISMHPSGSKQIGRGVRQSGELAVVGAPCWVNRKEAPIAAHLRLEGSDLLMW